MCREGPDVKDMQVMTGEVPGPEALGLKKDPCYICSSCPVLRHMECCFVPLQREVSKH